MPTDGTDDNIENLEGHDRPYTFKEAIDGVLRRGARRAMFFVPTGEDDEEEIIDTNNRRVQPPLFLLPCLTSLMTRRWCKQHRPSGVHHLNSVADNVLRRSSFFIQYTRKSSYVERAYARPVTDVHPITQYK